MAKKGKLSTPDWIKEGYDSPEEYAKAKGKKTKKKGGEKTFSVRVCPECSSDDVGVVIGEKGLWECHKCKYKGYEIDERELTEDEFMKYLDDKGEDVA